MIETIINELKQNKPVILPTDTLYGIFLPVSKSNREKLNEIKHAPLNKPIAEFHSSVKEIRGRLRLKKETLNIINSLAPGPYTFIVQDEEKTKGLRIVNNPLINKIIKKLGPLYATSANLHNKEEYSDIEKIRKVFPDILAIKGNIMFKASTIIDISKNPYFILRPGGIPINYIEDTTGKEFFFKEPFPINILVVCSGNTCRSPIAEFILKDMLKPLPINVFSRGINASESEGLNNKAQKALYFFNIPYTKHYSKNITYQDILKAYLILTMEKRQMHFLQKKFPNFTKKIYLFSYFFRKNKKIEIKDPFKQPLEVYLSTTLTLRTYSSFIRDYLLKKYSKIKT